MSPKTALRNVLDRRRWTLHGWCVALLLVLFVAKGVVWAAIVPPFQEPDGAAHVSYAEALANDPIGVITTPTEIGFSPTVARFQRRFMFDGVEFHAEFGGMLTFPDRQQRLRDRPISLPPPDPRTDEALVSGRGYPPLYYGAITPLLQSTEHGDYHEAVFRARLLSVALSIITLAAAYSVFRVAFGAGNTTLVGLASLAVLPMPAFLMSTINPDVLITMWAALLLALLLKDIDTGRMTYRSALGIGAVVGLGLLTKPTMIALTPAVLYVAARSIVTNPGGRRKQLMAAGIGVLAAVIIYGWFYLVRRGAPTHLDSRPREAFERTPFSEWLDWMVQIRGRELFEEMWGRFGWVDTPLPEPAYAVLVPFTVAVITVTVCAGAIQATRRNMSPIVLVSMAFVVPLLTLVLYYDYNGFAQNGNFVQARYFMVVAPAGLVLVLAAFRTMLPRRFGIRPTLALAWVCASLVLSFVALTDAVVPRYYG
jgi:hypothetical protein